MNIFFSDAAEMVPTDFVKRTGKYFECGKAFTPTSGVPFSVSEAEADAAIAEYTGGKLNLEHKSTVLDNLLGTVDRLYRDGANIMAEYSVPKWLHEATKGEPLKVSSEWDRDTKKPGGAALVLRPAVQDAVMMAAFSAGAAPLDTLLAFANSRHNTPEGQTVMQDLHDMSARSGAVCDRKNANMASQNANMASAHEATAVQKIHDIAADHGATCKSGEKSSYLFAQGVTMLDKLKSLFKKAGVPDADIDAHLEGAVAEFSSGGMTEAEKLRFAALEADNANLKTQGVKKDAEIFADSQIAASRVYPTERDSLITLFCQAAADDAASAATVSFSVLEDGKPVEKTGGRLDALRAGILHRPAHGLTAEQLKTAVFSGGAVLGQRDGDAPPATDVEAYLAATPLGQAVLAQKKAAEKK